MSNKLKNWFLVFLWAGFIFFLSSQPELQSGLPSQWDFILRKLAHITEYAILTWLLLRALRQHALNKKTALVLAACLAILYAVSDEYHQTFVFGRQGVWRDVLIDGLGAILILIFFRPRT